MFNSFLLGRYYPVRSKIHFMNPISKLLCFVLFLLMTFFSTTIQLNIFLIMLTLLVLALTNISIFTYLRATKVLIPIYLVIIIINIIFKIAALDSLVMIIRLTLLFLYITMLTLTTPWSEIIYGLEKLLSFLKIFGVNVSKLSLSITLAFRFLPMLVDEMNRILKSGASRGIDYYSSELKEKVFILRSIVGSAFLLTVKKIEDLKMSMYLRFYSTSKKRTNFRMNRWHYFDSYLVMMHLLILIVIIKKEVMG